MKIILYFKTIIFFLIVLVSTYTIHITFFSIDVIFYAAITDVIIATLISLLFLRKLDFSVIEKIQQTTIFILLGYAIAISVPTVIDRSLSFYILEKLQQRNGGIRLSEFDKVFTSEYMKEHHLIAVRITEQKQSGTIEIRDGCVRLTPKGSMVATMSTLFRKHFLPKSRLLIDSYTDELTEPFRNSTPIDYYKC